MKHLGIASFIAGVAIVVSGCSSSVSPGDSETHWIECKTTADCHGGETCERSRCVDPASVGARSSIANPTGTLLSAALMLEHLGLSAEAARLEAAVARVYRDGRALTPDQRGTASTKEMAAAVLAAYRNQ